MLLPQLVRTVVIFARNNESNIAGFACASQAASDIGPGSSLLPGGQHYKAHARAPHFPANVTSAANLSACPSQRHSAAVHVH